MAPPTLNVGPCWKGVAEGGRGAVMLMDSCDSKEEREWEELKEAEELWRLGRRRAT